jgi:DNA-binding winged helix-turn-helix (wHTH) protein/TolB-like protein
MSRTSQINPEPRDPSPGTRYVFGTFRFDSGSLELTREGRPVRLEPQPARALARLLSRPGEVVTREELRAAIWGEHTHVDYDRGLAYCLAQVRTALGDSADNPRFVRTLPKRGVRFLAPVATEDAGPAAPASPPLPEPAEGATEPVAATRRPDATGGWLAGRGPWLTGVAALMVLALIWVRADAPPRQSIVAVSIFDNETGDPSLDGFVAGLSDVVVSHLTELAPDRLGVIGNSAALRQPRPIRNLRTLAEVVPADYVVIGQLQRQGAGLRFILHFIRLRDEVHLSAQRLVRPTFDVAGLDEEVVRAAEEVVRTHILGPARP